tara:strand:- start:2330 stop:2629 length:300 start_codon:yes stop_codon:yes gene_type:complete
MFNRKPEDSPENPAPARVIDPVPVPAPNPVPTPAQNPVAPEDVLAKIRAWKTGDEIKLTGINGHVFNDLNNTLAQDKSDRGFRFNYDQLAQVLTIADDK